MGKYPASELLNKYSDWHYAECHCQCFMTDMDFALVGYPFVYRLWVEIRDIQSKAQPVAALDIKSFNEGDPTITSQVWYNWLEAHGLPVYIIRTDLTFNQFRVQRWGSKVIKEMDENTYIDFINQLGVVA